MEMKSLYLLIALAPLAGSAIAGLLGWAIGRVAAHLVTIGGVAVSAVGAVYVLNGLLNGAPTFDGPVYTWLTVGGIDYSVGFLIDNLTAMMMVVVTSVSLMVHIYTIGYMHEDPGYQRFFSYISLFTFSMLMLVMSNNFIQLFFGWEAVGLVSYLLIGFWFKKPTAIFANLKAFLVNRVGDFGFLLGIGMVLAYFGGSLHYADVFAAAPGLATKTVQIFPGVEWSLMTVTCILLFIGAMGKSAQFPLHVWLPDSMEGPTPISALIHAATMVTAGVYLIARTHGLFLLAPEILHLVALVGAITLVLAGFAALVQTDIKRILAYSTMSQIGYMFLALGVQAWDAAIFHLMTHAFFKALLFLGAGSVIMGMHHEQDMRRMGGLWKYMPVTWFTSLLGSLALIGTPFFAGFYSKDSIIEAVAASHIPGSSFAYFAVVAGVFITAFYSFRMYFLVFHGEERFRHVHHDDHHGHHDDHGHGHAHVPHESPWVVTLPLVLLAIPSVIIGFIAIEPMLFGDFFKNVIFINHEAHPVMEELAHEFHGAAGMATHALSTLPFWLALGGVATAWLFYMKAPQIPAMFKAKLGAIHTLLENKYYLDDIYFGVFAKGSRGLGTLLWKVGDQLLIDGLLVNGSAKVVGAFSAVVRKLQTGFIYSYATAMIIGVLGLMTIWFSGLIAH